MLTKTAIYKKYASLEDYNKFCEESIESLQLKFPKVSLKSFSEFKSFLDNLVPRLVHKYLLLTGTMKNCSGISPDFAEIGCLAGFPTFVDFAPGHQRNVVLTTDGPYMVDLSYVQFTCNHDLSDPEPEGRKEALEAYKALYKDPFSALKIEKLPLQYFGGVRSPHGNYNNINRNPLESIEKYDIEDYEETFPERFDRFKE